MIVIHANAIAPCRAVIIRIADVNIRIVALIRTLNAVDDICASIMRTAASVPSQTWFCIDRSIWLRRNEIESANVCINDKDMVTKTCRTKPIGVNIHKKFAAALSAFGESADLHDLPSGSDGDVTVGTVICSRNNFPGEERADLSESSHRCASREHRSACIEDDPYFAMP